VIVEQELPNSAYWGFQLGDVWSRPIEPMHRQSDINGRRAVVDADGRVRAVISQPDPGVPNWMDPGGRTEVVIVTRNYREISRVDAPTVTAVKRAELRHTYPRTLLPSPPSSARRISPTGATACCSCSRAARVDQVSRRELGSSSITGANVSSGSRSRRCGTGGSVALSPMPSAIVAGGTRRAPAWARDSRGRSVLDMGEANDQVCEVAGALAFGPSTHKEI
jgi:hypothetical protein